MKKNKAKAPHTERSPFAVDKNNLDEEWTKQAEAAYEYGKAAANAHSEYEHKKNSLEAVRAGLDSDIRAAPDDYNLPKVTEGAIANAVILEEDYQVAHNQMLEARHKYEVAKAAVNAMEHKKKALEDLVRLYGMSYFGEPQARDESQKEALADMHKTGSRRKGGVRSRSTKKPE